MREARTRDALPRRCRRRRHPCTCMRAAAPRPAPPLLSAHSAMIRNQNLRGKTEGPAALNAGESGREAGREGLGTDANGGSPPSAFKVSR